MFDNAQTFNSLIPRGSKDAIDYIASITVDEFNALINKPDFFISIADRLMFLNYITLYIENINLDKLKLVIDNIMKNDKDIILNNNIMRKRFLRWIKRDKVSNLLNYFLEIIPNEFVNDILENLFLDDFRLDNLSFNDYNMEIIDDYITKCSNDKLMEIFEYIYNSANDESNWREFIFGILIRENKLNFFLEHYKDLIDKSDNFTTFKDKEILVSLLVSLVNVKLEKIDGDEYSLEEFTNNLFDILALDNSKEIIDNGSKKKFSSPSKKLVAYMNELINPSFSIDSSDISTKILKNPILIKYILPKDIVSYGNNMFLKESFYTSKSNDEIRRMFLEDDERNINLINNLGSSTLIEFFILYTVSDNNLNDETVDFVKSLLKRYFSYEKAIFFVDALRINDIKKIEIINSIYQDKKIDDIKKEKEILISRCKEEILSLGDEVSDLFKSLLPELIELPYDEELFKKLMYNSLDINKLEYLFVYLSQYFKYGCNAKNMDYDEYKFNFISKYCRTSGSVKGTQVVVNYVDYSHHNTISMWDNDATINMWHNVDYIETTNHERTHLWQDKMSDVISMDALMIGLEKNLILDDEYYNTNYYNVYTEVHARIVAFYETFKYLTKVDSCIAYQYLERNKHLVDENSESKSNDEEVVTFIKDRKKAKSIEYFANLINTFLEGSSKEDIINLRKKVKTIALITDDDGRFLDVDEIEERMNSIKSYSTNDIEFNSVDRDTKLFYAKYLHNLRYCLDNKLINFQQNLKGRNNN